MTRRRLRGCSGAREFEVVESKRDLNNTEMRRTLRDFADKSRDADMAVVYYAGHGIEVDGMNYLIPVDAILDRDSDAYDEAITLDRVLQVIEPAKRSAPRHPRRVPRQSVRAHHETHGRLARAGSRSRGGRAGQAEHVDRVRGEGRFDRR